MCLFSLQLRVFHLSADVAHVCHPLPPKPCPCSASETGSAFATQSLNPKYCKKKKYCKPYNHNFDTQENNQYASAIAVWPVTLGLGWLPIRVLCYTKTKYYPDSRRPRDKSQISHAIFQFNYTWTMQSHSHWAIAIWKL